MTTEFNLLPADYATRQRDAAGTRRVMIVLSLLALLCAVQYFVCAIWRTAALRQRYDESAAVREQTLAETEALVREKRSFEARGQQWRAIMKEGREAVPVLEFLANVVRALPETGRLEYLLVDSERCHVDVLLPDLAEAERLTRRLGSPRGYGAFAAGGRRTGRSGLPLFRFDALKRREQ